MLIMESTNMASNDSTEIQKPTLEMKKRAVCYYNENMVPKHLEGLLNKMFLEDPDDLYGYMSEYFAGLAKEPILSSILLETCFSNNSSMSGIGRACCTVKGKDQFITELPFFVDSGPVKEPTRIKLKSPTSSKSKKDKAPAELPSRLDLPKPKKFDFDAYFQLLEEMSTKLQGNAILNQEGFDKEISILHDEFLEDEVENAAVVPSGSIPTIETPQEYEKLQVADSKMSEVCISCNDTTHLKKTHANMAGLYLSFLAAHVACKLKSYSLTEHLLPLFCQDQSDIYLPVPVIPILSAGISGPGKLNMLKTLYILPKPEVNYMEALVNIIGVVKELESILIHKFGAHGYLCDDDKVFSPPVEKVEQVFEVVHSALAAKELDLEDVHFIVDIAASDFYDEEKKKYEISTGQQKTSEDLIGILAELVDKYPVVGIIDGLAAKDVDHWPIINTRLGSRCHILGDSLFDNTFDTFQHLLAEKHCNGCRFSLSSFDCHSISKIRDMITSVQDSDTVLMMATKVGRISTLVTSDALHLAVASQATFVDIGSPLESSNIKNYNTLIEKERSGKLKHREQFVFQAIVEESGDTETAAQDATEDA